MKNFLLLTALVFSSFIFADENLKILKMVKSTGGFRTNLRTETYLTQSGQVLKVEYSDNKKKVHLKGETLSAKELKKVENLIALIPEEDSELKKNPGKCTGPSFITITAQKGAREITIANGFDCETSILKTLDDVNAKKLVELMTGWASKKFQTRPSL
jgi:hypothetical protein